MTVNFNNLRKQAVFGIEKLTSQLNQGILKESVWGEAKFQTDDIKGNVLIDADEIEDNLNNLIGLINTIACVHEEDNDEFKDLTSEIKGIPLWFNDEENINENKDEEKFFYSSEKSNFNTDIKCESCKTVYPEDIQEQLQNVNHLVSVTCPTCNFNLTIGNF